MPKTMFIILCSLTLLSACNTVQGVGEDISQAGSWTADSAKKVKENIP
jgi:predicted small secreted protein